jgi:hypothetical protein
MDDMTPFEDRFEERLRAFASTGVRPVDSAAVARAVAAGHPRSAATRPALGRLGGENQRPRRRAVIGPWRTRSIVRIALGAAAVVALVVSGAMLFLTRPGQPSIGGPSPTPTVRPSQSHAAAGPSASPSPTPTPLLWTQASLQEDWPAPVRAEPAGGAIVYPILVQEIRGDSQSCCLVNEPGRFIDPTGDTGSDVVPWLDISEITVGTYRVTINLASNQTPDADPTERWIAYGVVFDDDRDGVPDRRFGIDNVRTWMTDLHTGRTLLSGGGYIGGQFLDTTSPRGSVRFSFGTDTPSGPRGMELDNRPFYVWASMIQDGRVVATDYAPDVGWLDTSVQTTTKP